MANLRTVIDAGYIDTELLNAIKRKKLDIVDVNDLQDQLSLKAALSHTHSIGEISNLETSLANKAPLQHDHEMEDVDGLSAALAAKADTSHTHTMADISGLGEELATKPDSDPSGITGASAITNIVKISQADYNNLTPDDNTLYIVV